MNNAITDTDQKKKRKRALYYFLGSAALASGLTFLLKEPSFTDSQMYVLFLLFFSIGLWITEAIPPFAVSLFILAYLVYTMGNAALNSAPEKIDKYVNTFSSSIIWLLLGGFFISTAMTKTGLDKKLLSLTLKISGNKPGNIVIAVMFTTMVISTLMSNTATSAMVIAAITPLLTRLGKSNLSKALLLGVAIAATTGGMATLIGSPPNAIAAGILESRGIRVSFLEWMLYGLPMTLGLTIIGCFVLLRIFVKDKSPVSFDFLHQSTDEAPEPATRRTIVLVVIIITVLFWLTNSLHRIPVATISAIPIVGLTLSGIINANDVKSLPWDTLMLVAGGLSLGVALESTGILNHYANLLRTTNLDPVVFVFILAFITMAVSNTMSSAAAATVLIPMGVAVLPNLEKQITIVIGLASSTALMFPVSTPPNAIVYSTGLVDQKDLRIGGLLIGILGPLLAVLWVLLIDR